MSSPSKKQTPSKLTANGNRIDSYFPKDLCLKIRDNGPGISPLLMKEVLTSFGYINKLDNNNSQLNFAEHGIGLKINALRIGKTCLILSRKNNQVSVGLLSQKFI